MVEGGEQQFAASTEELRALVVGCGCWSGVWLGRCVGEQSRNVQLTGAAVAWEGVGAVVAGEGVLVVVEPLAHCQLCQAASNQVLTF